MSYYDPHGTSKCSSASDLVTPITRIWGVLTAIVMWGVGIDLASHHQPLGVYILICAVAVTFLEATFAVILFLELYIVEEKSVCYQFWHALHWFNLWKKTALYFAMAVFCFLRPSSVWLAVVSGVMLIVLAILYLIVTYKVQSDAQGVLLADKENSYDRFDDLQEEIDDALPEPPRDTVGDQDCILQV